MTTQISAKTLSPLTDNQIPVITTELLAQLYCVDVNNIQQNHMRNADRFTLRVGIFKATGAGLNDLQLTMS